VADQFTEGSRIGLRFAGFSTVHDFSIGWCDGHGFAGRMPVGSKMPKVAVRRKRLRKAPVIPKSRRMDVTRAEFDRAIDILNERGRIMNEILRQVESNAHHIAVQFTRISQIQAELDHLKRELERLNHS
jgi:hypothetical protein